MPKNKDRGYAWVAWYAMVVCLPWVTLTAYLPCYPTPLLPSLTPLLHIAQNSLHKLHFLLT